ncbi:HvfB family MNIO-type RiPP peptide maturase [[Pseudomonas] boreopolis]|uniref:HvfB family MNIO-type RiPP peptide maturase n=1 Tax=Xanthomonas boreopolis TaxID=86183 RepID=UPI003D9BD32E
MARPDTAAPARRHGTAIDAMAVGIGLRRALMGTLLEADARDFDFVECAPENWIGVGGRFGEMLDELAARKPLACHGLSLSLGGTEPLDLPFLKKVAGFMDRHRVDLYSEHLSYCGDDGHLYDLLPLPFTEEAVRHVAGRIRRVQDAVGRRLAVENISYYAPATGEMDEATFVKAILSEADCDLLLDVNNVYVNAANHGYDAAAFLAAMPAGRVRYYHVAGHYDEPDGLKIDTHGAPVKDPVWALLAQAYRSIGPRPTLLERDANFPDYGDLRSELQLIRRLAAGAGAPA